MPDLPEHESQAILRCAHLMRESIGDAVIEGRCQDTATILTEHPDCDICLLVDQYAVPGDGRHALLRMNAEETRTLGEALILAALSQVDGGRRVYLRLSGQTDNSAWTDHVRAFARRLLNVAGHETKVLKVRGQDPVSGVVEPIDLLHQKLTRRVDIEKPSARSKALDKSDAYRHIETAIREVRETDLPNAAVIF